MSLLKRNGKSKNEQDVKQSLEPPPSPSAIFRKSTSIEPPGSDTERPQSQQSGKSGGGKKKIIPSFFSNLFGNSNRIPESLPSSHTNAGGVTNGSDNRAVSHESINSVLSSSSFSFVNPTNYGGKRVKGKRIPVDDPNYGSTTANNGKANEEKKSGTAISTLDKIGIKIGLKKKYNLQSCESLQYIDACEEPRSSGNVTKTTVTVLPSATTTSSPPSALEITEDAITPIMGQCETTPPSCSNAIVVSSEVPASPKKAKTEQLQVVERNVVADETVAVAVNAHKNEDIPKTKIKTFSESCCQTVVPTEPQSTGGVSTSSIIKDVPASTSREPVYAKLIKGKSLDSAVTPLKTSADSAASNEPLSPPEPQPSTSASAASNFSNDAIPSTSANFALASTSNTWSNSGRRKRRAPQPPNTLDKSSRKFTNGVSEPHTSVVTDIPNDVPSSSSQAAQLKKFTKIEASPPPPPGKQSVAFEIRPRKKERSVEPLPVTRPTSSFASPTTCGNYNSNSLFTRRNRYHKRSCSEGTSSGSNTNTRGRVHKPGKKKAPAPPNPFGDPDTAEEESVTDPARRESSASATPSLLNDSTTVSPPKSTVTCLPPTAPPKLNRRHSFTRSTSGAEMTTEAIVSTNVTRALPTTTTTTTSAAVSNPFEIYSESELRNNVLSSSSSVQHAPVECNAVPTTASTVSAAVSTSTTDTSNAVVPVLNTAENSQSFDDLLDEIRQNLLNDQQERQQLGLLQENNGTEQAEPYQRPEVCPEVTTTRGEGNNAPPERPVSAIHPTTDASSSTITETDIVSAQRTLEVLSASISTSSCPRTERVEVDTSTRAKIVELKKEADQSPLNALRGRTRPVSIGSSIYESPLAMLLGKATSSSNNHNNGDSSVESSPKIPQKPWYKRGSSSALARQLTPNKLKQTTQVKPFTALVKFSELDKEAARIVEENRRKSAERRLLETEQELMELFSSGLEEPTRSTREPSQRPSSSSKAPRANTETAVAVSRIRTEAQVHPTAPQGSGERLPGNEVHPSTSHINHAASVDEPEPQEASGSQGQTSSSPTFQSVHAASKHRKIKPLLTSSPSTNMRSEKLAIVQPQTNNTLTEASNANVVSNVSSGSPIVSTHSQQDSPLSQTTASVHTPPRSSTVFSLPSRSENDRPIATTAQETTRSTSGGQEWDCPRCTLKNPSWRILCEICFQRKDPPSNSSMSSILQRVNSESNKIASTSVPTVVPGAGNTTSSTKGPAFSSTTAATANAPTFSGANTSSSSIKTTSVISTNKSSIPPTTPSTSSNSTKNISTAHIPSGVDENNQGSTSHPLSSLNLAQRNDHHHVGDDANKNLPSTNVVVPPPTDNKRSDIPSCENFLSQLPDKNELAKEGKLSGMKLHEEDPELEELDIGKLRKARLAYFQKQKSTTSAPSTSTNGGNDDSMEMPVCMKRNDLGSLSSSSPTFVRPVFSLQQNTPLASSSRSETNEFLQESTPHGAMSVDMAVEAKKRNVFADTEDDFLDYMLQLDKDTRNENDYENATTVANIPTSSLPGPQKPVTSTPPISQTIPTTPAVLPGISSVDVVPPSPSTSATFATTTVEQIGSNTQCMGSPPIQNRYKPKLAAIREGNSQDYTYCYSSREVAQIYENWQASQGSGGRVHSNNISSSSSSGGGIISSNNRPSLGSSPMIPSGNLLTQQQRTQNGTPLLEQTSTTPTLAHHNEPLHMNLQTPLLLNSNIYPIPYNGNSMLTTRSVTPMLPTVLADHQPYANNSPEENYVNTANRGSGGTTTPTLLRREGATSSLCATSPTPISPSCSGGNNIIGNVNLIEERQRHCSESSGNNHLLNLAINGNNYENNNMSLNPNGSGRRLTYEDYRRMGAIPKGFSMNAGNDDWSSESSSDSSRGMPLVSRGMGYPDCSPGITRRGTLDVPHSPTFGFPDQTMAVSKLMKRLETAIANGDHRLAATLAHDLALMKVNCVVAKINQPFSVRVYVEDRCMQQGPFLVQVSSMMTVRDLKLKIERDWGIPSGFQRWILGRKMAEDDTVSLTSFEIAQDSMAFLFLVSPELGNVPLGVLPVENKVKNTACSSGSEFTSSMPSNGVVNQKVSNEVNVIRNSQTSPKTSVVNNNLADTKSPPKSLPILYNNISIPPSVDQKSSTPVVSSPRKVSSVAQTTSTLLVPSQTSSVKGTTDIKKEASPPPLPPKSPTSNTSSNKTNTHISPSTPRKVSKEETAPPRNLKSQNVKKENTSNAQQTVITSETLSTATALTLSLQQKLSEFKAVAEQTLGNPNIISLPPKQEQKPPRSKDMSPAPSSSKVINSSTQKESSPRAKVETNETKPPIRRTLKNQLSVGSSGSSKEKLVSSNAGSRETLPVLENRFNGVLLQTSKEDEHVKPPARSDKGRKTEEKESTPTPHASSITSDVKSSEVQAQATKESIRSAVSPSKEKDVTAINKPLTDAEHVYSIISTSAVSSPKGNAKSTTEEILSAPQPKPRGIKKQPTVEKTTQETESIPVVATTNQVFPKPLPRKVAAESAVTAKGALEVSEQKPKPNSPVCQQNDDSEIEGNKRVKEKSPSVTVDDSCQTTLPFPTAKYRTSGIGFRPQIDTPTALGAASPAVAGPSTSDIGNRNLLRPSAFVTQLKPNESSVDPVGHTSVTNSSPSSHKAPFAQPIAIAHIQPLNISPFRQTTPTPTACISPSVIINEEATVAPPPPLKSENSKKKEDDSAPSYLTMLELMEKQDLIYTSEDAECPVCFTSLPTGDGIILRDCLHVFCKECLVGCVQYADDSTVKCPYRDNSYACNNNLQEREIKALVPSDVFEKYLARSVKLAESKIVNTFHCKTPDCTGWCVFEDDVNVFLCPVCKKRNCLTCAAIHEGIDCQKYQRELAIAAETDEDAKQSRLMLERMIQRGEALDCPACHVVLLKKWGCDWVRCSYCKTEICWVTKGFRWGPGGKGDVSGGCKCGVNGVKCHPKCTYCH